MSGRQSLAVSKALARVRRGSTPYAAAKREGIALSTIYRALKRLNAEAQASPHRIDGQTPPESSAESLGPEPLEDAAGREGSA